MSYTLEQNRAAGRRWRQRHPGEAAKRTKAKRDREQAAVYAYFDNKCNHCGLTDERTFELDHIHNDGYLDKDNRSVRGGAHLCNALLRGLKDFKDFQLLCANCHKIKHSEQGRGHAASTGILGQPGRVSRKPELRDATNPGRQEQTAHGFYAN